MITFDEVTHSYTIGTENIPSVTQIMKPLSQMKYSGISDATMSRAAERGTLVHNAIENWLKYGYDDCPEDLHGYFEAFKAWQEYFPQTYIASECRVYNEMLRYAGTVDMVIRCENSDICIVDFKTTSDLHLDLVKVQLEAYAKAYRTDQGEKAKVRMVVQLKPDGKFDHKYWGESTDTAKAFKVFTACRAIYDYMQK